VEFLIHTLLQCLSPNTTGWNEFSSNMASTFICLAKNEEKFNFSNLIFDHVAKALDNSSNQHYLYQSFLQLLMDK
jgi:recombinational DNA repair protein (RecF pathway)